jgi:hypothetical protein
MLRLCRLSIAAFVICAASAEHADEPKVVKDAKEAAEMDCDGPFKFRLQGGLYPAEFQRNRSLCR